MVTSAILDHHISIDVSDDVSAPNSPANFYVHARPQDVANYIREGNDLILNMNSGESFRIEGFFTNGATYNNLVLNNNGVTTLVDMSAGLSAASQGLLDPGFVAIEGVAAVGASGSVGALLGILGAAGAVGGVAVAVGGGGGSGEESSDVTAPSSPSVDPVNGYITRKLPTFTGEDGEYGARVEIRDTNGNVLGSTTVGSNGRWSVTLTHPLPEGAVDLVVVQIDEAGNVSPGVDIAVLVDTIPPANPAIDPAFNGGTGSDPTISADRRPDIHVGAGLTDTPVLYVDGQKVASTYDPVTGILSPTVNLSEGLHSITYRLSDVAGNESGPSNTLGLTVDTLTPAQPSIIFGSAGGIQPGGYADSNQPTLSGQNAEPGALIEIRDTSGNVLGSTTVGSGGTWSAVLDDPLPEGSTDVVVVQIDGAGHVSPELDLTVTVDTVAPADPVTDPTFTDAVGSDPAASNDSRPDIHIGSGLTDTPVLYVDGQEVPSTYDPVTGILTPTVDLSDGPHSITYTLSDAAGNESAPSNALNLKVDTLPPAQTASIATVTDDAGLHTGSVANGGTTDDDAPTLSGTLSSGLVGGEVLQVLRDGVVIGTASVSSTGWSYADSGVVDGRHSYTVQVVDTAGNRGPLSSIRAIEVDATPPTQSVSIVEAVDDQGLVTGSVLSGEVTDDMAPLLRGTLSATLDTGNYIEILRDDVVIGTASVSGTSWSYADSGLVDGSSYEYTARIVDTIGNAGSVSAGFDLTVSTFTLPQTISLDLVADDVGPATGAIGDDAYTDDSAPLLSGTLSAVLELGEVVEVLRDGVVIGTVSTSTLAWSYADSGVADGSHSYRVRVRDAVGNISTPSGLHKINVDTLDPTQTATITGAVDNAGNLTGTLASQDATDDTSPMLSGTLSSGLVGGEVLQVLRDGVVVGTASVSSALAWSYADSGVADGSHSYTVQVVDKAGNLGPTSSAFKITVDTLAPTQTGSIAIATDDVVPVTGAVLHGGATNDNSPLLSGTLSAGLTGEHLEVLRDNVVIGTASVSGTSWSYADSGLADGSHTYSVRVVDQAGNQGSTSSPFQITVDRTAPTQTASITVVTDDAGLHTGSVVNGGTTDDDAPTLSGTLSAKLTGELLEVLRDGVVIGTASVSNTAWSYADSGLTNGSHSYTVQVVDTAGNRGSLSSVPFVVTVDATPPTQSVSIVEAVDDYGLVTGSVLSGEATDDMAPLLRGTLSATLDTGNYIEILRDNVVIGTASVSGTSWSYADSGLVDGSSYEYTARIVDTIGNAGSVSAGFDLTVSTFTLPQTISLDLVADDVGPATGAIGDDAYTDDSAPLLSGTLSAVLELGEVIEVLRDAVVIGTVSTSTLAWSYADSGLTEGSHSYRVRVRDAVGNISAPSGLHKINVDTLDPTQTATITGAVDNAGNLTGTLASQDATDDTSPTLTGTLSSGLVGGEVLQVLRDGVVIGTASVSTTNWSYADSGVADGSHSYTVQVVDKAGNLGPTSSAFKITVDTLAPTQTGSIAIATDDVAPVTGAVLHGGATNDNSPLLSGTLSAGLTGEHLEVLRDNVVIGTASVSGTSWNYADSGLADGSHSYSVRVVDQAGNRGSTSATPFELTVDTGIPAQELVIVEVADNEGSRTGALAPGATTDDASPTLEGTLSAKLGEHEVLEVLRDGVVIGAASVGNTFWSYADSGVSEGSHSYTVQVVDEAGNLGPVSDPFVVLVDTLDPTQTVTIVTITDDFGPRTGSIGNNQTTNDNTPLLSGMLSSQLLDGEVLEVLRNGMVIGTASVSSTLDWNYADSGVADGSYSYTVQVIDKAGNLGPASDPYKITVDTLQPTQTATIVEVMDDVGSVTGSVANGGATDDTSPLLSGTLSAPLVDGEVLEVLRDGVVIGTASVSETSWSYADSGLTNGTSYSYTVQVVDAAGNQGSVSDPFLLDLTVLPPATPTILGMSNDTGTIGDFQSSAGSTVVSGRSDVGSTVEVFVNNVSVGTVVTDSAGVWQSSSIDMSGVAVGSTVTVKAIASSVGGSSSEVTQVITRTAAETAKLYSAASLTAEQGFVILPNTSYANLGYSVSSAGDVNGDGIDDIIVGAYGAGGTGTGEAYVIFGRTGGFGTLLNDRKVFSVANLTPGLGFVIQGDTNGDQTGWSVSSAGDVNGDGIDDLIVGAYGGDDGGDLAGEAYVIFGKTGGFVGNKSDAAGRTVIDVTSLSAAQGFIIQGDVAGDRLGGSVSSAGDVNGDGIDDLIVGATYADYGGSNSGAAYVIFGTTGSFGTTSGTRRVIDTTNLTPAQGFIIFGDTNGDQLGVTVSSAGDVNGDGIDDLIVGSGSVARIGGGMSYVGASYVIFGTTESFGAMSGTRRVLDLTATLTAAQGFVIEGDTYGDYAGISVSDAGDVNGDGIDDLIVGAYGGSLGGTGAGQSYVIFGSTSGFGTTVGGLINGATVNSRQVIDLRNLTAAQGFIILGDTWGDQSGRAVSSAGDVNGDGIDDLIVGSLVGSLSGVANSGQAYVIFGTVSGFGTLVGERRIIDLASLDANQGFIVLGNKTSDQTAYSVSSAGDVNGDGFDDVIVGAYQGNDFVTDAGQAYVIFGAGSTSAATRIGTAGADFISGSSSAESISGGGGADVLLGYGGDDAITVTDTAFARIDGGAGNDKLFLSGGGLHLNLTALANDVITNVETIDITGTGNNTLTLNAQDLLDLSSTTNTLIVNGNAGDAVHAIGFTDSGTDQTVGTTNYDVYTNGTATLWLDKEITNVVLV